MAAVMHALLSLIAPTEGEGRQPMAARKKTSSNAKGRSSTKRSSTKRSNTKRSSTKRSTTGRGGGTRGGSSTGRGSRSSGRSSRKSPAGQSSPLSRSTLRAKWIESPDDHEDYPGQTLATRNHDVIRRWAEERGAVPATVPGTEHDGQPGVLTFDFPRDGGENLEHIGWDEWFRALDERNLVFLFQEHLETRRPSNDFNLDSPEREAA
jgi:hypothetical protein